MGSADSSAAPGSPRVAGSSSAAGRAQGATPRRLLPLERLGTQGALLLQSLGPSPAAVAGSPRELQIEACWEHSPAPPRKCPLSSPTGSPSEESAGQPASLPASQPAAAAAATAAAQGQPRRGAGLGPGARCARSWPPRRRSGRSVPAAGLPRCLAMGLIRIGSDRCGNGRAPLSRWRTGWAKLCLGG